MCGGKCPTALSVIIHYVCNDEETASCLKQRRHHFMDGAAHVPLPKYTTKRKVYFCMCVVKHCQGFGRQPLAVLCVRFLNSRVSVSLPHHVSFLHFHSFLERQMEILTKIHNQFLYNVISLSSIVNCFKKCNVLKTKMVLSQHRSLILLFRSVSCLLLGEALL